MLKTRRSVAHPIEETNERSFRLAPLWLGFSASLLFIMGLLMVFNTTAAALLDRSTNAVVHTVLLRQFLYGGLGVGFGLLLYWCDIPSVLRYITVPWVSTILLLILVFIPSIGQTLNGAHRWIGIGSLTFQPSEAMKVLLPLYLIAWFIRQESVTWKSFLRVVCKAALPILLILLEPDNGTVAILFLCVMVLCVLCRIRVLYWGLPLLLMMIGGALVASRMPHVSDRIRVYLHPESDLRGKGHQPYQAKIAAGSGRLWGRGLGESLQKLNYLPEARSDYIAAIFAEEFGFIGMTLLILLYLSFAAAGFLIALRAESRERFLVAAVLTFLISIQAFLNLGVVSGLLPSKGLALPFFSQGGSALIANIVAVFLILGCAKNQVDKSLSN